MPSLSVSKKQAQEAVCATESKWTRKKTAQDIYGGTVQVADTIQTVDGQSVSQWFYETTCSTPRQSSCKGVDTKMWSSECLNRDSFVYAVVIKDGETGWFWIRISTACNCALQKRSSKRGVPYPFVDVKAAR